MFAQYNTRLTNLEKLERNNYFEISKRESLKSCVVINPLQKLIWYYKTSDIVNYSTIQLSTIQLFNQSTNQLWYICYYISKNTKYHIILYGL